MRVLHVSQPVDAGVAAVAAQLCVDQRARGWDARIACPPGPLADRMTAAGVPVEDWRAARSPGASTVPEARALRRIVDRCDPDVVHLHSAKAGLAGRLAVRGRRPTLFQPHAWSFDAVTGPVARAALGWERLAARWTHRLIAVSDAELAAGRAAGVDGPATVVPNGVDTTWFTPAPAAEARAALGLPEAPTVVCVGRVTRQKGQDLLLAAWPRVRQTVPAARLVLVGDGEYDGPPLDASVRREPASADPRCWYRAAEVVALPSRWEGMPLVALEAMACGRPVVGFDVTGVAEAVGDGGAVVPPGDLDALAGALAARLVDGGPGRSEGQAARTRVLEHFGSRLASDRVAAVVREVHGGTR